jgi:endonuclease-3
MHKKTVLEILHRLAQEYPNPKTALKYNTPFQLLVATILSAQSTDVQVNKITDELFKKYSDVYHFVRLSSEELEKEIKGVGLFRNKSKNIIAACKKIIDKYQGNVPETLEELIKLPGVGRKTANVVLANAFDKPAIAVDTHVFRVANRIGLTKAKTPEATEFALQKVIPKDLWSNAHHWLINHGRQVCHARKPKCSKCILFDKCRYDTKASE